MRAQRQEINLLQAGGASEEDLMIARGRYRVTSAEYTRFSKAMDLPQQRERVMVDGLGTIGNGKYKIPENGVANSGNSGIINISDSNSIYREITQSSISSVPKMNIFNDETLDNAHREASRDLLREVARHKELKAGTEFSIVYDEHMNPIPNCGYIQGGIGNVRIDNPNVPYHAFHNHGSGETFSYSDIYNFSKRYNMISLTAVGNTGSKFVLCRNKNSDNIGYSVFLKSKVKEIIYSANGTNFTYEMIDEIQRGKKNGDVIKSLSQKQISELKQAIVKMSEECLKGGNKYGIKYISS